MPERLGTSYRCLQLTEGPIRVTEHPGDQHREELANHPGVRTRPIWELHVRIEHLEAPPKARKRRFQFPLVVQHPAERHMRPNEAGRIIEPFGDTQHLLGKMLRLLHLEQVQMVELQAAERREPPGIIPELPTELRRPRVGPADVRVAGDLGRGQGGTKRHLQIQLTRSPLARIRQRFDQCQASLKLIERLDVRRLPRRGHPCLVPVRDRLRWTVPFGIVMRHQFRLRARHLGKAILQQLCHPLVILLAGAFQQRLVGRILDQRMLEQIARARRAAALVEQLVSHELAETALQHLFLDPGQCADHVIGKLASQH